MDIQTLTTFFMWCTILNLILMSLSFLICVFAADWAYRLWKDDRSCTVS